MGSVPPQQAVPDWIGAAHPNTARPRSTGETSATLVESKGGQRLSGAESNGLRSLATCPSWGLIPEAAHCIPGVCARLCAWDLMHQSSVPLPRASAAAAQRGDMSLRPG